ncbi:oxidoreductase [Marinobacter psychrophilus]|uniref:Oxidoreductase n=1 Tax=Marinobacter psychrophilus TaxID=330734 RepID=A0A0H4ICC1_9GAMM|nr:SDR family oxidoreductase [Marinobacter psychrophilus]AKO52677.1 oxidoreductase [Marinobacter psychrophilus]
MSDDRQVALVTGGAHGIGRGIVSYLLTQNWRVAFFDLDDTAANEIATAFGDFANLLYVRCNVADEGDVKLALRQLINWGGRLDALVNNAGLADPVTGAVENLSLAEWQKRLDVNLTGPFLMAKHSVPHLRLTLGAIVNIASTRAMQSEANTEAYAATKGGLVALTHALAISLGPEVRVNCISPGWIDTREPEASEEPAPLSALDHVQHPAGRVGTPDDIAAMVHYLVSPQAKFITGQNIVVDGGMVRKMIYHE